MYNIVKSILKTAVYIMDQADQAAGNVRDRAYKVSDHISDKVSDKVSDLADQGRDLVQGEDNTLRNVVLFASGIAVGVAAGMLLAPASGEEIRGSMRDKVEDIGDRMRDKFAPATGERATGTEGGI